MNRKRSGEKVDGGVGEGRGGEESGGEENRTRKQREEEGSGSGRGRGREGDRVEAKDQQNRADSTRRRERVGIPGQYRIEFYQYERYFTLLTYLSLAAGVSGKIHPLNTAVTRVIPRYRTDIPSVERLFSPLRWHTKSTPYHKPGKIDLGECPGPGMISRLWNGMSAYLSITRARPEAPLRIRR